MTINSNESQLGALLTTLEEWKKESPIKENRVEAKNRILDFFNCEEKDCLDLSNLSLSSLPDIFNEFSSRLKHLSLSHNQLTILPNTIGDLSVLTRLDLDDSFIILPNTIFKLTALQQLYVNDEKFINFPDIIGYLSTLFKKQQLDNSLKCWEEEALPGEERLEAGNRIFDFFISTEQKLDLSNLNLSSLPDIFNEFSSRLKYLFLDNNKLTNLPNTISSLLLLEELSLNNNMFTSIPDIGNLSTLKQLHLNGNRLEISPGAFSNLSGLTELRINNKILAFSNIIDYLSTLSEKQQQLNNHLKHWVEESPLEEDRVEAKSRILYFLNCEEKDCLDLSNLNLSSLPDIFNEFSSRLKYLSLDNNQLTTLPGTIDTLQKLQWLYLNNNQLITLPDTISNLSELTRLHLSNNSNLSTVPMQILQLPTTCTINFMECHPSSTNWLRRAESHPDYAGPVIRLSEEKSIQELLIELYRIVDKDPLELSKLKETEELRSWLIRLSDIADYQKGGEFQKTFVNNIIEYLKQANESKDFYEVFYKVIQDASETCGDRVALSVLHLSIAHQLSTIALSDMKVLANFFKDVWAVELLEQISINKIVELLAKYKKAVNELNEADGIDPDERNRRINALNKVDEIEVYLGYPIKLKEKLNLPIGIQEMLYFTNSDLTSKDLEEAEIHVKNQLNDQEVYFGFLISKDRWKEALKLKYSIEYEAILDSREKASEKAESVEDYSIIEQAFRQALIELTRKALDLYRLPTLQLA
jgi:Leucine-rich repeat (LRR) protein